MKGKLPEPGKISVAEVEKIDEAVRAANASGKVESAAELAKKTGIFNDTNEVSKTTIRISNGSEYFHKQDVDGLNELIKHLTYDVDDLDFEPNKAMISKIKEMISNKQALTGAYKDFYEHELTESMLMKQGFGYNDAHNMALTIHEVRPQALYSPEIVRKYYEWFNRGDYEYWGIK